MEFTGERYVPGVDGLEQIYAEHMSRYAFASQLAGGGHVLDVGCGCGYGAHYLGTSGADLVVGFDLSSEAIRYAKERYGGPNVQFAVMDTYSLAFDGAFDLVTCFEVIEHVEFPERALREIHTVLTKDGVLLISTPNKLNYVAGGEGGSNPFHFREYEQAEFGDLLHSIFPCVQMYGQLWSDSVILKPVIPTSTEESVVARPLPDEEGPRCENLALGDPVYFMAICAKHDLGDHFRLEMSPMVLHSFEARHSNIKKSFARLKQEFDKRGRWANGLETQVYERDETIRLLRGELDSLRTEFDQRGEWAQSLEERLNTQDRLMRELTEQNQQLTRMAGLRARR
jgi:SAM-dependent methyltransferase